MRVGEARTRRRGAALEQAILDAAWAALADRGWDGFTIGAVADRCGTAKAVLYRRWDNRVELAQDMLVRALRTRTQPDSTGDLRADLLRFLHGMQAFYDGPFGQAVRGVLMEREDRTSSLVGPEVPAAITAIFAAAVERGDLVALPPPLVQNLGQALMTIELVHTEAPLDAAAITTLVDDVWLPALLR